MWNIKNKDKINEQIKPNKNIYIDTENRVVVIRNLRKNINEKTDNIYLPS